jgi:hypothetical protein
MTDYARFIQDHFLIVDKTASTVPFVPNQPQGKLLETMTDRNIILKARQEGISAIILAIFATDFLLEDNSRSVVIAHESGATARLFDRVKFFIRSFEEKTGYKIPLKYNSRAELTRTDTNATFYVGTAGAEAFGRGDTIFNLHASELAFWPNPEETMTGLMQALAPNGKSYWESTANGYGNYFHTQWERAVAKESNVTPHFFSYMEMPEYQVEGWRESKMSEFSDPRMFAQEYPATPEEAFLSSGNPFFDVEAVKTMLDSAIEPIQVGGMSMEGLWL